MSNWISVDDYLPDTEGLILICDEQGSIGAYTVDDPSGIPLLIECSNAKFWLESYIPKPLTRNMKESS